MEPPGPARHTCRRRLRADRHFLFGREIAGGKSRFSKAAGSGVGVGFLRGWPHAGTSEHEHGTFVGRAVSEALIAFALLGQPERATFRRADGQP